MKNIIQFSISKGDTYYVAQGVNVPVVTQGKTLDELVTNVKEALSLELDGEKLNEFDLNPHPSVLMNLELPIPITKSSIAERLRPFTTRRCVTSPSQIYKSIST